MRGVKQKEMFEISDLRRREILHLRSVCPTPPGVGEKGTLICSYIRGLKLLNFNIFGGFQKTEHFWGYEDFVDIFFFFWGGGGGGGSSQNWLYIRGNFYAFKGLF